LHIRHLKNAPITEAIIDVRVKARANFRAEEFAALRPQLSNQFPKMEEQRGKEALLQLVAKETKPPIIQDLGLRGLFFKTADEKSIAQFRIDGFTFNRLKPYTSWEEIFPLAMELWERYRRLAEPEAVTRLAVRYINPIPLIPSTGDFAEYLRAAPVIPPELPQHVSRFVSRITIHDPDTHLAANIGQVLEVKADKSITLILDIDAYREVSLDSADPVMGAIFEDLRVFKNKIFFSSITEQALRRFE